MVSLAIHRVRRLVARLQRQQQQQQQRRRTSDMPCSPGGADESEASRGGAQVGSKETLSTLFFVIGVLESIERERIRCAHLRRPLVVFICATLRTLIIRWGTVFVRCEYFTSSCSCNAIT